MSEPSQSAYSPQRAIPFRKAVGRAFRKAFIFSGRASRSEFWWFALFWLLVSVALIRIWSAIFGPTMQPNYRVAADGTLVDAGVIITYAGGWLSKVFNLVCLLPALSLGWRRLHDSNCSGLWLLAPWAFLTFANVGTLLVKFGPAAVWQSLIGSQPLAYSERNTPLAFFVIIVGFALAIYLLVQLVRKGTPGSNRFGPNPLEVQP